MGIIGPRIQVTAPIYTWDRLQTDILHVATIKWLHCWVVWSHITWQWVPVAFFNAYSMPVTTTEHASCYYYLLWDPRPGNFPGQRACKSNSMTLPLEEEERWASGESVGSTMWQAMPGHVMWSYIGRCQWDQIQTQRDGLTTYKHIVVPIYQWREAM